MEALLGYDIHQLFNNGIDHMINELVGKRVLFICPSFFGYEVEIKNALIELGASVDYYDERPFSSSIEKILNRLNIKFLINSKIKDHYNNILRDINSVNYDFLFVVAPETMNEYFIRKLKYKCPSIKSILYLWDSIKNKKNVSNIIGEFDKVVTFDRNDNILNNSIDFLPLFYIPRYDKNLRQDKDDKYIYNVSFIGTVHSGRYKIVKSIVDSMPLSTLDNFMFFYCPSKLLFVMKKLFTNELNGISYNSVSFTPLTSDMIADVLSKSKYVIDIEHPQQSGLTMRTIEMLGLQKKLITTNKNIINYDFFQKNNICIIDRIAPKIDSVFLNSDIANLDDNIIKKYSLKQWLCNLFN